MRSWASPQLPAWRSCCLHLAEETPQKWRGTGLQDKEVSDPSHGTSGVKPQKSDWGAPGGSEGHRTSALSLQPGRGTQQTLSAWLGTSRLQEHGYRAGAGLHPRLLSQEQIPVQRAQPCEGPRSASNPRRARSQVPRWAAQKGSGSWPRGLR